MRLNHLFLISVRVVETIFFEKFGSYAICLIFALPKNRLYLFLLVEDSVAQLVEHDTFNVGVLGSSPSGITKHKTFLLTEGFFVPFLQTVNAATSGFLNDTVLRSKNYH